MYPKFHFFTLILLFFISFLPADVIGSSITISDTSQTDTTLYTMDKIVVTATRYQKKIIDIPYPVIRLVYKEYRFQKPAAVDDVLNGIPGLFLQSRYGNHDVRISIRGFGSRSNSGIRGVRILLDDIPESEPDGQTRIEAIDFNSLGKIELVKGNSSSLYTNAPGGVINFMNDRYFPFSTATQFNDFASFGLQRHGIKIGLRTPAYTFLCTYSYHRSDGFRRHSDDYWHIVNSVLEISPSQRTSLRILGYFVDGQIRLPGSLTKEEYDSDPWQAAPKEVEYDFRRYTRKGRLGLRFTAFLDQKRKQELELTGYGTIKYFERTTKIYRIMNRFGLGLSLRYVNRNKILGRENEFSLGGDLLHQTGPVEAYQNINGQKSDTLTGLTDESIGNRGLFFLNSTDLFQRRLYLLLSGRYDWIIFDQKNQILAAQNDVRTFQGFTPKVALNYKFSPWLSLYSSWGLSFDSPAGNELDNYPISSEPDKLMNPDLQSQESNNLEVGIKGDAITSGHAFFQRLSFEASLFHYIIDNEIVPFEVFGEYFFRNSAKTIRDGLEVGSEINFLSYFRLKLAFTYSDFVYDQYTAHTVKLDDQDSLITADQDFSQNHVPSIPENNIFVALSFEKFITAAVTGYAQLKYAAVSGMYVDDANSEGTEAFQIVGLTLGLDGTFGAVNTLFSMGINNLFDERYVSFININSTDQRFYEAGAPRNYFATLKFALNF